MEVIGVKLWAMDEPLAKPGARLNPGLGPADLDLEGAEAGQFGHGSSIVDVVLLQTTEISVTAAVKLLMQPRSTGFLGAHPQQEHTWAIRGWLSHYDPSIPCD